MNFQRAGLQTQSASKSCGTGFAERYPARISEGAVRRKAATRILDFSTRRAIVGVPGYGWGSGNKKWRRRRGPSVAEPGYVRDREREFTEKQPPHKDEALRAFDRAIAMVVATIRKQKAEDWGKEYTADREPLAQDRFTIFVRCAGHAYHHVGQIVYLSRELART